MFAWLLIILGVIACIHFVYEGIIVPSCRRKIRYALFALRDDLRALLAEEGDNLDLTVFSNMQDSINASLRFLHHIDIRFLYEARKEFRKNESLANRVSRRYAEVLNCDLKALQNIRKESMRLFLEAFAINSMGFLLMMTPIWLAMACVCYIKRLFGGLKRIMACIIYTPESESQRFNFDDTPHLA